MQPQAHIHTGGRNRLWTQWDQLLLSFVYLLFVHPLCHLPEHCDGCLWSKRYGFRKNIGENTYLASINFNFFPVIVCVYHYWTLLVENLSPAYRALWYHETSWRMTSLKWKWILTPWLQDWCPKFYRGRSLEVNDYQQTTIWFYHNNEFYTVWVPGSVHS